MKLGFIAYTFFQKIDSLTRVNDSLSLFFVLEQSFYVLEQSFDVLEQCSFVLEQLFNVLEQITIVQEQFILNMYNLTKFQPS